MGTLGPARKKKSTNHTGMDAHTILMLSSSLGEFLRLESLASLSGVNKTFFSAFEGQVCARACLKYGHALKVHTMRRYRNARFFSSAPPRGSNCMMVKRPLDDCPPSITYVHIVGEADVSGKIPHTIRRLYLKLSSPIPPLIQLPNGLTDLALDVKFRKHTYLILPPTLRSLSVRSNTRLTGTLALPDGLKSLELDMPDVKLTPLPKSVRTLILKLPESILAQLINSGCRHVSDLRIRTPYPASQNELDSWRKGISPFDNLQMIVMGHMRIPPARRTTLEMTVDSTFALQEGVIELRTKHGLFLNGSIPSSLLKIHCIDNVVSTHTPLPMEFSSEALLAHLPCTDSFRLMRGVEEPCEKWYVTDLSTEYPQYSFAPCAMDFSFVNRIYGNFIYQTGPPWSREELLEMLHEVFPTDGYKQSSSPRVTASSLYSRPPPRLRSLYISFTGESPIKRGINLEQLPTSLVTLKTNICYCSIIGNPHPNLQNIYGAQDFHACGKVPCFPSFPVKSAVVRRGALPALTGTGPECVCIEGDLVDMPHEWYYEKHPFKKNAFSAPRGCRCLREHSHAYRKTWLPKVEAEGEPHSRGQEKDLCMTH